MRPDDIKRLIETGLPDSQVRVAGEDGTHFEATVITEAFNGKRLLERHRMVYGTLGDRMQGEIHALSIKAYTPQEWAAQQG